MSGNLNRVMLIGRLGRDPEVRYTKDGTAVANLSVATDEQWTDKSGAKQERTEWHRVVLWGRQAEVASEYLQKGRLVYVEGRLETRKWQDQNGQDKYSTEVKAMTFQMLDRGDGAGRPAGEGGTRPGPPRRAPAGPAPAPPPSDEPPSGPPPSDDDIPF